MRTLLLFLMIAVGTLALLYCRVNLGMSWDDMSAAIKGLLPKVLAIGVVMAGLVATLSYIARSGRSD